MYNANKIRSKILIACKSGSEGHIASAFSIVEMLIAVVNVIESAPGDKEFLKDFVLSKGHAVLALYALMNEMGLLSDTQFSNICLNESALVAHVPFVPSLGLSFGTGSLGHGLPFAIGKAFGRLSASAKDYDRPVYTLVGDGELNEGTSWESFLMLLKFRRINIRILVDFNGSAERGLPVESALKILTKKFRAVWIDGHDINCIKSELDPGFKGTKFIICNTRKGFPLKEMIDNPTWHHRIPTEGEMHQFLSYFNGNRGD